MKGVDGRVRARMSTRESDRHSSFDLPREPLNTPGRVVALTKDERVARSRSSPDASIVRADDSRLLERA
jgi:hypothetical protein